jgi:hypothetical protein
VARRWEVFSFMLKTMLVVVVGVCAILGQAFAYGPPPCWQTVTPQNVPGFDFEITSVVQGPDKSGLYAYTYTIYRLDQGFVIYRDLSHISFWFPCGPAAEKSVLNGIYGITVTCTDAGSCPKTEMGGTNGMAEPVMDKDCKFFWGFKLDECKDTEEKLFLMPNLNEISFPQDPYDPSCTITFKSRTAPAWGKWLVKGGDGKSGLYDAGDIRVPNCVPAVDVGNMTWGAIKVIYR